MLKITKIKASKNIVFKGPSDERTSLMRGHPLYSKTRLHGTPSIQ